MIHFDTTKSGSATQRSGLTRVSRRLLQELGAAAAPVGWPEAKTVGTAGDWFFTAELFSEAERPGFGAFLASRRLPTAALFHDAIPLKLPHITWPQSVARHPGYLKLLASFDRVFAVSRASKAELEGFWSWQGLRSTPPVEVLALGADFVPDRKGPSKLGPPSHADRPQLLCVGILEPRKNQGFLLDVCDRLWASGLDFELHLVGRENPHFGGPIVARIKALSRAGRPVRWHGAADDDALRQRYAQARVTVSPTIAEGCGLPLLESLFIGVPCVCSDLPVLRENADGGGCVPVVLNDPEAWSAALRRILTDNSWVADLRTQALARVLPTWAGTAKALRAALGV